MTYSGGGGKCASQPVQAAAAAASLPASQPGQAVVAARQPTHLPAHSYVNMTEGQYGHPMAKYMYLK